jgi:hypothetical protein
MNRAMVSGVEAASSLMAQHPTWLSVGVLLGLTLLVVAAGSFFRSGSLARTYAYSLATFLGVVTIISAAAGRVDPLFNVLGALPALLIAQHAVYLGQMKNPFATKGRPIESLPPDYLSNAVRNGLLQAQSITERDFGWSTLSFRFGVPAALLMLVIGVFGPLLYGAAADALPSHEFVRGARYAGAGAYVYVLLYLSRRNFRHDITSGAAVWSAVNMVVGPILGGIAALLWKMQEGSAESFASAVVFFSAGLAPRHMASVLEETAKRLMRAPDDKTIPARVRSQPLTMLRGVTRGIADRLEEDGIEDLAGMAMADPARLMRNTSFDQRQIVSWIDEAILITSFPDHWEKLESAGVTGAIDLAWYGDAPGAPAKVETVAAEVGLQKDLLWAAIQRLYWDGQVQLIWVLYQIGLEGVQATVGREPSGDKVPAAA